MLSCSLYFEHIMLQPCHQVCQWCHDDFLKLFYVALPMRNVKGDHHSCMMAAGESSVSGFEETKSPKHSHLVAHSQMAVHNNKMLTIALMSNQQNEMH